MTERQLHAVPEVPQDPMVQLAEMLARIDTRTAETNSAVQGLAERVSALEANAQPTAEMPVADGSGDGGRIPADVPPVDGGQGGRGRAPRSIDGNGDGQPPTGGNRGGEGPSDNPNRKNWGKRVLALGAVALIAAGAVIGFQKLTESSTPVTGGDNGGGKNVANQKGPASKLGLNAGEYKRLAPVANNPKIDTVNEAERAYKAPNWKVAASDILDHPEAFRNVDISHFMNRMNATSGDEGIQTMKAVEFQVIGFTQSEGLTQAAVNSLDNRDMRLDRDDTQAERLERLQKFFADKETKIDGNFRLRNHWLNGSILAGTEDVRAKVDNYGQEGKRAIRVYNERTGEQIIWKLDADGEVPGLCNNISQDSPEPKAPESPDTPPAETPDSPPPADEPQGEPERPRGRSPKADPGGPPAGVRARGPGTGTSPSGQRGPGRGPAGQAPDPQTGRVRGEAPVAAQPQNPTPAPLPVAEAPAVAVDGDGEEEVVNTTPAPAAPPVRVEAPAAEAPASTDTVAP